MSELQESIIRMQTIIMLERNRGKQHIVKRIVKRFMKCMMS
jgi:hypothetical protein